MRDYLASPIEFFFAPDKKKVRTFSRFERGDMVTRDLLSLFGPKGGDGKNPTLRTEVLGAPAQTEFTGLVGAGDGIRSRHPRGTRSLGTDRSFIASP
ncbi:MAG TPA: hypothetical protein VHF22_12385 [Planctomycetota bacterium]|nr:hypothetical protein [Planctomycetota bacterium]